MRNYSGLQRALKAGPAIPKNLNLRELESTKEITNKILKKYIDQVRSEPSLYVRERSSLEKLFGVYPKDQRIPLMYHDHWLPSFYKTLLYGLDFEFLVL